MPVKFVALFNLFTFLLLAGNVHCQATKGNITLVENRISVFNIILPDEPSRAEQKAAGIFQDYVRRISGAILPIIAESSFRENGAAVFIGKTAHTLQGNRQPVKGEGFDIRTAGKHLYITGGTGQGVVYGVYTFLDRYLGCRKYAAGQAYTPQKSSISFPSISIRESPSFVFRQVFYPESNDPEYLSWHKLHQFEDLWGLWGHSFFKIIPPGTYFKTHPEYFAEVNGKRQPSQLCLSNTDVLELTTSYMRKAIAANPDAMYWSIGQEDGGVFCTCSSCRKTFEAEGSHAGSLVRFMNKIAARFPEQSFTTLAYGPTSKAPLKTAPASNVLTILSNIDAYREEPLEKAPSAAAFRKDLDSWKKLSANLFIWDYTTQFTNYPAPFPAYTHGQENAVYYHDNKVRGAFIQGSGDGFGDMSEWNSYLYASLLWNPRLNKDSLFKDFTAGYYGKAAEQVQAYIAALARQVAETKARLDIYGSPIASSKDYLSPESVQRLSDLLSQAEKQAGGDTAVQRRLIKLRLPLAYTILEQAKYYGMEPFGFLETANGQTTIRKDWPSKVNTFIQQAKLAGVSEMAEGGKNPDEYLKAWEQLFDRTTRLLSHNKAFGKPVVLTHPFTPEYTLKKERTLTDALPGTEDFSYNWLFTYGNDMIATIDLEKETVISSIQMNFLSDARHYIFLPNAIVVETSSNGKDFTLIGKENIPGTEEDYSISSKPFTFQTNTNARYIRVKASVPTAIPAWRMAAAARKPALCIDEVYVK